MTLMYRPFWFYQWKIQGYVLYLLSTLYPLSEVKDYSFRCWKGGSTIVAFLKIWNVLLVNGDKPTMG